MSYKFGAGLVLIQSQTASSSTTLDFINLATFNSILVLFEAVQPATNSTDFQMLQSTNNGSTFLGTGSYAAGINVNTFDSATLSNTNSTALFPLAHVVLNTQTITGFLWCFNMPNATAFQMSGQTVWNNGTKISIGIPMGQGVTGVNALRFQMAAGAIASGKISLYGAPTLG